MANFARAEALCEKQPAGPGRLPALVGLAVAHQARGDLARSGRWASELLEIADALKIAPLQMAGHAMLGASSSAYRTFEEACAHFERVYELAEVARIPPPTAAFDLDVAAGLSGTFAMCLVLAGRPDEGLARLEDGLARSRALGHPFTSSLMLGTGMNALHFLEDHERLIGFSEEALGILAGRGWRQQEAIAHENAGWARVMLGDAGGAEQYERGLGLLLDSGAIGGIVQFYVEGAELSTQLGRFEEADERIERAAEWIDRLGQKLFYPNVTLLRAERILAARGDPREAEQLLLASVDGWRVRRSKWMELRAALRLGEVALLTGDKAPARARLAELMANIRGGGETKRLAETRRMLAALSA
jgi:tetratricopeptide (TPR) repeat protein